MASNPKRALILYSYNNVNTETPALNMLCQRGCGGQLLLESSPLTEKGKKKKKKKLIFFLWGWNKKEESH